MRTVTAGKGPPWLPMHRQIRPRIQEPLQAPNLGLQVESFDRLLGNDAWKARVEAAQAFNPPKKSSTISPIEDVAGAP